MAATEAERLAAAEEIVADFPGISRHNPDMAAALAAFDAETGIEP